ncbi:MAG TPA: C40 family peptidase [Bacteroidia bacterium]|jgi:lipoprotein Spr|nr:C40 family peptidase [Bacteroidia bacterium]
MKKCIFLFFIPLFTLAQLNREVETDSLISFAKQYQGTKYCYGNCTPKSGFDCSGFVYYVFGHFNIKVPRASLDYEKQGRIIQIDSARKGDIIVFTGTKPKNRKPGHVGIVISNSGGDLKFIHSSSGKKANGIIITDYSSSPYYKSRFIKIVRVRGLK